MNDQPRGGRRQAGTGSVAADMVIEGLKLAVTGAYCLQSGETAEAARMLKAASRMANRAAFRQGHAERAKRAREAKAGVWDREAADDAPDRAHDDDEEAGW